MVTVIFFIPELYSFDELTEHVNTVPLSVLFTDWNMRTDKLFSSVKTLFHETSSEFISGTAHVIVAALPTVRFLNVPVITISTGKEKFLQHDFTDIQESYQ